MVVGNDDAGAVLEDRAPRPPELPVLAQVVEHRLLARLAAGDAESAITLVDLVAGEECDVWVLQPDVANHATLRKDLPVIAGEYADPQPLLFPGIFANDAAPVVLLPLERIGDAVLDIARFVPSVDAENRRARQALDGSRGDRCPARSPARLEPGRPLILIAEWREVRCELERSPAQRVLRPQDGPEGLVGMRCQLGPSDDPIAEAPFHSAGFRPGPAGRLRGQCDVAGQLGWADGLRDLCWRASRGRLRRQLGFVDRARLLDGQRQAHRGV